MYLFDHAKCAKYVECIVDPSLDVGVDHVDSFLLVLQLDLLRDVLAGRLLGFHYDIPDPFAKVN